MPASPHVPTLRAGTRNQIVACERGAIAVFGLFAAILMAASVYYFAGLADGILKVERAQDAADAMAFSSAAMRARGMNALAMINIVSSALLSVAAALRVLEVLSTVGVTVLALTGQLSHPQARLALADFEALRQEVRTSGAYLNAADRARVGLNTLEEVARVVRITVPWSADKHVIDSAVSHYLPEMSFGTALPAFPSLPVHMEGGVSLCERVDANARLSAMRVVTALLPPRCRHRRVRSCLHTTRTRSQVSCSGRSISSVPSRDTPAKQAKRRPPR